LILLAPTISTKAYYELFQAAYNNAPFPIGIEDMNKKIEWYNYQNIIPLGIIDCYMQQVDPDAYKNGLVDINNDMVYNTPGQTTNIFVTKHPQLISPLFKSFKSGSYQLLLEPWMVFSNTNVAVSGISISINGGGSIYVPMNGSASITLPGGDNYLDLLVYFANGTSFTNKCAVSLQGSSQLLRTGEVGEPCAETWVKAAIPYQGYNETRAIYGKNKLGFYFADCNNQTLRKPVILLDGLDPKDSRDSKIIYNDWFNYIRISDNRKINVANELRIQGYDVIIVDMPHYQEDECPTCPLVQGGADYIQRNAMVLVRIIDSVNAVLAANSSTEQLVIVGPSMGGQISRYALTYMEEHNMPHRCRLWVSFDSPHLGANLPIGLQHYVNEMANMGSKEAQESRSINLEAAATREQLLDYYGAHANTSDIVPRQDPIFSMYYNEQNNQGIADPRNNNQKGWPVNCRRISMISGVVNGVYQQEGQPGSLALRTETKPSGKAGALIGAGLGLLFFQNPLNPFSWLFGLAATQVPLAKGDIWASPASNQTSQVTYANYLFKNRSWNSTNSYSNVIGSMDLLPGGKRAFFKEVADSSIRNWYSRTTFDVYINHSNFIPTTSSLALGKGPTPNPNRKWDDNLYNIDLVCNGETPFDAYYGPINSNLRHDSLFEQQALYLLDEINGTPMFSAVDYSNIYPIQIFSGSEPVCGGTTYQVANLPAGATVTWEVTPQNVVSLSQSGNLVTVTKITDGLFTLIAKIRYNNCSGTSTRSTIQSGGTGWQQYIYGPTSLSCGEYASYQVANNSNFAYNWSFPSDWTYAYGQGTPILYVQAPSYSYGNSSGDVSVTVYDGCDYYYSSVYVDVSCGYYYYSMSPNPASSTITVSSKETNAKGVKVDKTITEINIYDKLGNLKMHRKFNKEKKVDLNISNLSADLYYLEIVDGTYKERQKLSVVR
jgi:pimeloyl-ACP methyl ester carboxylesterase